MRWMPAKSRQDKSSKTLFLVSRMRSKRQRRHYRQQSSFLSHEWPRQRMSFSPRRGEGVVTSGDARQQHSPFAIRPTRRECCNKNAQDCRRHAVVMRTKLVSCHQPCSRIPCCGDGGGDTDPGSADIACAQLTGRRYHHRRCRALADTSL